jgi:hypothetical protein
MASGPPEWAARYHHLGARPVRAVDMVSRVVGKTDTEPETAMLR